MKRYGLNDLLIKINELLDRKDEIERRANTLFDAAKIMFPNIDISKKPLIKSRSNSLFICGIKLFARKKARYLVPVLFGFLIPRSQSRRAHGKPYIPWYQRKRKIIQKKRK